MRRSGAARARQIATPVLLALAWLLLTPAVAEAHAELESSSPADGDRVATLPSTVTLTFSEDVSTPAFVAVTGPDGENHASGAAVVDGTTVTQGVAPTDQPGAYTVSYRVVSDDGHPITGSLHVEVGSGAAAAAAAESSDESSSNDGVIVVVAVVAVIGALVALTALMRRPGSREPEAQ